MNLLLDTHAFLWWITDSPRLSATARTAIADAENSVFVSAASGMEIAIKAALGKLELPKAAGAFVEEHLARNSFTALAVEMRHSLGVFDLPLLHRDPFDRLIVAQAKAERLTIVSADALISRYDIDIIW